MAFFGGILRPLSIVAYLCRVPGQLLLRVSPFQLFGCQFAPVFIQWHSVLPSLVATVQPARCHGQQCLEEVVAA